MPSHWRDISFLLQGTARQQHVYYTLQTLNIFSLLHNFDPVLTSTISLGIDIPGSDLDIICEAYDLSRFQETLKATFGQYEAFQIWERTRSEIFSVVARFPFQGWVIEIYGESLPVEQQNAYRHLSVAARLLEIAGEEARAAIQRLKASGLKTEPAFAEYFGIKGDPYRALLELETFSDEELRQAVLDNVRPET